MTSFKGENLGVYSSTNEFLLEPEKGIAYAKATNDPIEVHLDGTYMPPVYGVVPVWEKVFETLNTIVPPEHFFSVVHGEQDMIWHKPLKSGINLRSRAKAESIAVKESGTTLVIKAQSVDAANDELFLEQYFTMFFRGVHGGDFEGNFIGTEHKTDLDIADYKAVTAKVDDPDIFIAATKTKMDLDQTYRYSKASGDMMPIHIDEDFAKSVGLGGIIIHGLCTMANASSVIINQHCGGDPTKLSRMSLRFANPLRPGDEIQTSLFHASDQTSMDLSAGGYAHYFKTIRTSDSIDILTNGLAYIRL
jgi:acyl dehydratase